MIRWQSWVPTHSPTIEDAAAALVDGEAEAASGEDVVVDGAASDADAEASDGATVAFEPPEHAVVSKKPSTTTSTPCRVRPWPRVVTGRS